MATTETWYRGATIKKLLTVVTDGEPRDLTTATVELQVKADLGAADPPLIALAIGEGITLRDQTTDPGLADIVISSEQTDGLTPGTYWFDVVAVFGSERYYVVEPTKVILAPVVNRR